MQLKCKKCGEWYYPICKEKCPKCSKIDIMDEKTMKTREQMRKHMYKRKNKYALAIPL